MQQHSRERGKSVHLVCNNTHTHRTIPPTAEEKDQQKKQAKNKDCSVKKWIVVTCRTNRIDFSIVHDVKIYAHLHLKTVCVHLFLKRKHIEISYCVRANISFFFVVELVCCILSSSTAINHRNSSIKIICDQTSSRVTARLSKQKL